MSLTDDGQHVGYRYLRWCHYREPRLTSDQKARALEEFATEFEALLPRQEPYKGWGEIMARLCRRIARQHRDEPA